ncbi:MAG: uL15 family ribosomal protein [Euryarchaeota archaeon]|nr:uL15 family ribosomal protein [Euryarchaeota archaeon]MDE1835718.1 uL15 family ribosomal protein [Euryarchaeota archaeon]MDE1880857.1 uL15 family ribosomal protein [Euryarchaeota archaeon]MDE2043909.1 uL15 family ribosomal protein [Thermoplasmata archaeon]
MPSRTRKFRGSRTHGRGIKAGRGAGKQGGRGNAGLHKYKFKSMLIYAPDHFGRHGFKRPAAAVAHPEAVNVGELSSLLPLLQAEKALKMEGDARVADLSAIGIDRLLGGGKPSGKWKVYVEHASDHAKEKVEVLSSPPGAPAAATPSLPKTPPARPGAPATTAKGAPPATGGSQPRAPATKPAATPAGSSKTAA